MEKKRRIAGKIGVGRLKAWVGSMSIFILLLGNGPASMAQDQEIQQLLLNVEKLNQLKELLAQMKANYEIVQQGYLQVKSVTEGNFHLHEVFLNRLYTVNPKVKAYYRVGEIIQLQVQLLEFTRKSLKGLKQESRSSLEDIAYLSGVFSRLQGASMRNLEELILLITDGQFQMDDAERIQAIDRIYSDMRKLLLDSQQVTAEFKQLFLLRSREKAAQFTLKSILSDE